MLISYRWLTELLGTDPGASVVEEKLTQGGLEIEGVAHVGKNLASVKVARVVSSRPHPSSKNPLTLVTVDIGGAQVEVVCGAPNVPAAGGLVVFAPLGTTLLDKKGASFTLEAKPIAGIVSQGMLCAEDELGLGTDHSGIVVLDAGAPGQSLTDVVPGAEDWILSVNVTPNRPDALGHIGVARDVAALLGIAFRAPEIARPSRIAPPEESANATVELVDATRCPRYDAAVLRDVAVHPSPLWLRIRLHRLGVRPINNVVDVTNLVMLERGQPLHAFDLREVRGSTIVVRRAKDDEPIQTLDGVHRKLTSDDLVIADRERPLALAGVMGGEGSGIANDTNTVLLESAYFEPRGVRRTARRHGIHSEASHRFERDVDIGGVHRALVRAAGLLCDLAGATAVGNTIDAYPRAFVAPRVQLRLARIAAVLGVEVPETAVRAVLASLDFQIAAANEGVLDVQVPTHRPDVTREIDVIEEVGRVYGYGKVPSVLPPQTGARAGTRRDAGLRRRIRTAMAALGLDEAVSYAFVSARDLESSGFGASTHVRITNPLSEERSLLRPSLLPGLFRAAAHAQRHGVPGVRLFEVGTVFSPDAPQERGLAHEVSRVASVLTGPRDAYLARPSGVDFFDAKGVVEALARSLTRSTPAFEASGTPPPWAHPRRFARVMVNGHAIGLVAELHPDVREALDLPTSSVAAELDVAPLGNVRPLEPVRAPSRFPNVRRDVALLVERSQPAGAIGETLREHAGALCERVELFDRYEGKELPPGTHSLAFALWFRAEERTLTDDEVDRWREASVAAASRVHGAKQR
jgi:phenylalanyl-tRNA synthetase beta chain